MNAWPPVLKLSTCQAEIGEPFCAALAAYFSVNLGIQCDFIGSISWQERERLLLQGDIQLCWICGLAYVRKNDTKETLELIAAPVRKHPRYGGRPVYYSDVIVPAESGFHSLKDLRGRIFGYNEPGSHSGCNVVRYHVAAARFGDVPFARFVESGSHRNSIQMILEGRIDAAAIDSTVLEMEVARDPSIALRIRTIDTLGPSPAPPWVVHRSVPADLTSALRREFLAMDKNPQGQQILEAAHMLRFESVSDSEYDPIREMDRIAASVMLL